MMVNLGRSLIWKANLVSLSIPIVLFPTFKLDCSLIYNFAQALKNMRYWLNSKCLCNNNLYIKVQLFIFPICIISRLCKCFKLFSNYFVFYFYKLVLNKNHSACKQYFCLCVSYYSLRNSAQTTFPGSVLLYYTSLQMLITNGSLVLICK